MTDPAADLDRFYYLLGRLEQAVGGARTLADILTERPVGWGDLRGPREVRLDGVNGYDFTSSRPRLGSAARRRKRPPRRRGPRPRRRVRPRHPRSGRRRIRRRPVLSSGLATASERIGDRLEAEGFAQEKARGANLLVDEALALVAGRLGGSG